MAPGVQRQGFASQIQWGRLRENSACRRPEPTSDMVARVVAARRSNDPAQGSAAVQHGVDEVDHKDPKRDGQDSEVSGGSEDQVHGKIYPQGLITVE